MIVYCQFANGRQTSLRTASEDEAVGYFKGLAAAAHCLDVRIVVVGSLQGEIDIDDSRTSFAAWLEDAR